jgi:hypothetical protein
LAHLSLGTKIAFAQKSCGSGCEEEEDGEEEEMLSEVVDLI